MMVTGGMHIKRTFAPVFLLHILCPLQRCCLRGGTKKGWAGRETGRFWFLKDLGTMIMWGGWLVSTRCVCHRYHRRVMSVL
ncbi:hypothetical protein P171DRAFT_180996 [Karstenula rhodostoma CBS 690.94]|uniref:Uncharacterized protein n=1 Tax=Karstenula rhodostoma CBS 690.94 TaxID=1392251 RepID=A0A9P4U4S9_9PLEO|nr:hypothetical protein P171DRAFT_180996 [Karstenula rhodostoma CBS 690.94]